MSALLLSWTYLLYLKSDIPELENTNFDFLSLFTHKKYLIAFFHVLLLLMELQKNFPIRLFYCFHFFDILSVLGEIKKIKKNFTTKFSDNSCTFWIKYCRIWWNCWLFQALVNKDEWEIENEMEKWMKNIGWHIHSFR